MDAQENYKMPNIDTITSQVLRDLNKYADAGLIDENELYSDAVSALKRFGNDICTDQEAFVEIKNGLGQLPDQFFSLKMALECEPDYYQRSNIEHHTLLNSVFYTERVELSDAWNECDSCCKERTEKVIRENVYFDSGSVSFTYKNPRILRLTKGFEKSVCATNCLNNYRIENPHEINIINRRKLQTNFSKGTVYIRYKGLPVDDEGFLDIPETANGHLDTYIEYYLKRRTAERLIGNNDALGLQTMYPIYKQEESLALRRAVNELKMTKLTPRELRKMMIRNRQEILTFEVEIPTWH